MSARSTRGTSAVTSRRTTDMRASRTPRGVTLVEVVVALGASAIVLAGIVVAVKHQQEAFNAGQRVREAQGAARNALLLIGQKLPLAGYGIDPTLALDLSGPPGGTEATQWYTPPCATDAAPCRKDRTDGSDELVFHARDPMYYSDPDLASSVSGHAWIASLDLTTNTVTLQARPGDLFLQGQILQLMCDQGAGARYATVRETTGAGTGVTATPVATAGALTVNLAAEVSGNPFRRQSAGDCQPTRAYLVDRFRFHVLPVQEGTRWESYLLLDRGLDVSGPAGVRDGVVDAWDDAIVAAGVEIFQVAYEFTQNGAATLAPAGLTPGTPITIRRADVAAPSTTANSIATTPFALGLGVDGQFFRRVSFYEYGFSPLAAERRTNHQANISAVHVAIVARAPGAPAPGTRGSTVPGPGNTVMNLDTTPAWILAGASGGLDGQERIRAETTVTLSNLASRRLLFQ